jgi:predicted HTH transcriptional regulator
MTDADKVSGIVREGETKYVEFKETLSLCIRTQTKNKELEHSALKNVVAFLNTDGGKLLIGVSDDGQILGLDTEIGKFHKNLDKFLLYWNELLKVRIGGQYNPFIEYRAIKIDGKHVLFVECKPSQSPCHLDGKDFYMRTNPATEKLEGPKLLEYVKNHFK